MTRALIVLAALGLLSACGVKGDLTPAPPMFGSARADYEQQQADEAAKKAAEEQAAQAGRTESNSDVPNTPPAPGEATPAPATTPTPQ